MEKFVKITLVVGIVALAFGMGTHLKDGIDANHNKIMAASYKSPAFSPEELAREIPDGLEWNLVDKDGYAFDWDVFCLEHENCMEAFRAKGVPFPQYSPWGSMPEDMAADYDRLSDDLREAEQNRREEEDSFDEEMVQATVYCDQDRDDCPVQCTTDADCRAKFGGDGGPEPREEKAWPAKTVKDAR